MNRKRPVPRYLNPNYPCVVVWHDKHSTGYWIADNQEQLLRAYLDILSIISSLNYYDDEEQEGLLFPRLTTQGRVDKILEEKDGTAAAIFIMDERCDHQYEKVTIEEATRLT